MADASVDCHPVGQDGCGAVRTGGHIGGLEPGDVLSEAAQSKNLKRRFKRIHADYADAAKWDDTPCHMIGCVLTKFFTIFFTDVNTNSLTMHSALRILRLSSQVNVKVCMAAWWSAVACPMTDRGCAINYTGSRCGAGQRALDAAYQRPQSDRLAAMPAVQFGKSCLKIKCRTHGLSTALQNLRNPRESSYICVSLFLAR